jgi:choline dehydrogenase-like flavoprotein
VASRLAENKSISVAVIEAGPNAENLQEVLPSISLAISVIEDCPSRSSFLGSQEPVKHPLHWIGHIGLYRKLILTGVS